MSVEFAYKFVAHIPDGIRTVVKSPTGLVKVPINISVDVCGSELMVVVDPVLAFSSKVASKGAVPPVV